MTRRIMARSPLIFKPPTGPLMHRIIFAFFLLSGFTSLVFEVIWERLLMQVFGATTFAISTLLTAFMAGLALGSALGGRVASRLKRPLRVYGLLEGCIGLYALTIPWQLDLLPALYGAMFDHYLDELWLFSLMRFVAVFAILLIPTTLMGATLPIVSQWVSQRERMFQGSVGLLYGTNTLGACLGCALAGFVALPALGLARTNLIFALTNFALCAIVLSYDALTHRRSATQAPPQTTDADAEALDALDALRGARATLDAPPPWLRRALAGAFALSGALSMSYQILWTRAYVIVLGSSTYSFTVILVSFLVGLSLGSAVMSAWLGRLRQPVFWLAMVQLGVCLSASIAFFALDQLPELLFHRLRQQIGNPNEVYLYHFGLVSLVVFIPTFLQGMTFPLIVRALLGTPRDAGREVGKLYAFNTAGSIAGSFLAGFALLPWLGLSRAIALIIAVNLALGAILAAVSLTRVRSRPRVLALGLAVIAAAATITLAPPIDRVRLTRGLFRAYWARELFDERALARDSPALLYYRDGVSITTSVERRGGFVTLKGNGKAEASDGADMATQILVGLLPFVFRSGDPARPIGEEQAVMIGFGSGVTAGGSLQWPLRSLEVIEIEAAMSEASRFFDHVNHRPLEDKRTKLIVSDGRNYLEYTSKRHDVIVSEPSNPWIAGVAAMFTVEHFERARRHLKPGGVFSQWVQLYELHPDSVRTILATFATVFPHVQAFSSMPKGTDLILIGSDSPIPLPADGFERAWAIPSVRAELERAGIRDPYDIYGLAFMSQQELRAFAKGAALNTDDNGLLEFQAPRDMILYRQGEQFFTERYHKQERYGDLRDHLQGWGDRALWSDERVARLARGAWRAGKFAMADELLKDAGLDDLNALPSGPISAPFDTLEQLHLIRHAQQLDPLEAIIHLWPDRQDPLYPAVIDAARHGKQTQAMNYLEGSEAPEADGYSGLRGLFYAFLLLDRGYVKQALRQLDRLIREDDPQLRDSPALHLLRGQALARRLRYHDASQAYLRAGELLLD